jgi:hypothetical protein
MTDILTDIPSKPQRQDSVLEQLADLQLVANRLGMYDAADAIRQWCKDIPELHYGCHCDLEDGMQPDSCVLETHEGYCIHSEIIDRKEQCEYWQIINE